MTARLFMDTIVCYIELGPYPTGSFGSQASHGYNQPPSATFQPSSQSPASAKYQSTGSGGGYQSTGSGAGYQTTGSGTGYQATGSGTGYQSYTQTYIQQQQQKPGSTATPQYPSSYVRPAGLQRRPDSGTSILAFSVKIIYINPIFLCQFYLYQP